MESRPRCRLFFCPWRHRHARDHARCVGVCVHMERNSNRRTRWERRCCPDASGRGADPPDAPGGNPGPTAKWSTHGGQM